MLEQRLKELDERVTNVHQRVCHQEHITEHIDAYWHTGQHPAVKITCINTNEQIDRQMRRYAV